MDRNNNNANQKLKTHLRRKSSRMTQYEKKELWVNYSGDAEIETTEYVGNWKSLTNNTKYFLFRDRKQWKNKHNKRLLKTINLE